MSVESKQVQQSVTEATAALAERTAVVIPGSLPVIADTAATSATAEEMARAMATLASLTTGLRSILKDARSLEADIARVLVEAWRASGPGNAKQFKSILGDCEAAILKEEKVEKWADLGSEARSYVTYKSHFAAYIAELKASCPDNVEPVTLRRQVSRWYADHRTSKGQGATAAKGKDKEAPPVVQTGEKDTDGTPLVAVVGMSKTNIRAKGPEGKYETVEVTYPTEVIGALTRLHKQIGAALYDKMPVKDILAAIQTAHDMLGPKPRH